MSVRQDLRRAAVAIAIGVVIAAGPAARGASPAAFGRRCIPAGCVAPSSNIPDILSRRALPAGRLAALGETPDLHDGLLAAQEMTRPNTLTPKEQREGWRLLFDGKTAAGWRGFRQQTLPGGWQAINGALTRVGQAGDIVTIDEFGDFELMLEWKLSPNGNSGIFYRVTEDDDVMWHVAPEYQIIDNAYKEPLKPGQYAGANYDMHPPSRDVTKPIGSWNQTRLVVRGAHVEHWLNGAKVVEYELWTPDWERRVRESKFKEFVNYGRARRGHIGLQDHGDQAAFRNIKIRELTDRVIARS